MNLISVSLSSLLLLSSAAFAEVDASGAEIGESAGRAFTFEDAIAIRHPLRITPEGSAGALTRDFPFAKGEFGIFSPNKKTVFTVDRRGDLERGVLIDTLNFYEADALASLKRGEERQIKPFFSVERTSATNAPPVNNIRWRNDKEVSFLGVDDDGVQQLYILNIKRGSATQLTFHSNSVISYMFNSGTLAYFAGIDDKGKTEARKKSRPIGNELFSQIMSPHPYGESQVITKELFVKSRDAKEAKKVPLPPSFFARHMLDLNVSPSGERVLFFHPYVDPLPEFAEYAEPPLGPFFAPDMIGEKADSFRLGFTYRLWSYDVKTGKPEPLMKTPYGAPLVIGNQHDPSIIWINDHEAIIPALLMPLAGVDEEERQIRANQPAIAYVNLRDKTVDPILYQPAAPIRERTSTTIDPRIVEMRWDKKQKRLYLKRAPNSRAPDEGVYYESYRKHKDGWVKSDATEADFIDQNRKAPSFIVSIEEGLNTPPAYTVETPAGDKTATLRRLNPQFDEIALARTEKRTWTDRNGLEWRGGLVYPVDYQPGKKYPFILQTHGFVDDEYLINGMLRAASPYAARAFSARGFFVLQMTDGRGMTQDTREAGNFLTAYEHIIDELSAEGLIDRRRVGAIGFSRTAFHVMQAAWRNPDLFASVTANDGIQYGYTEFFMSVPVGRSKVMGLAETNGGVAPFGEGLDEWRKHSLSFNTDKVKAAVLVEPNMVATMVTMWETYAALKFLGTPVDLLYHPDGAHSLQKPGERYISQKYNVQWHQFWLTGVEDPDPAFEGQYDRWRKMRGDHCASLKADGKKPLVYCEAVDANGHF